MDENGSGSEQNSRTPFITSLQFPPPIKHNELTPTEQRVYLQISLEFQKMLDEAPSFQMGAYQWNQKLPETLQRYAITSEVWERISEIGDRDDDIQAQLEELIGKMGS